MSKQDNAKNIYIKPKKFPFVMVGQAIFDYTTDANAIKLYLGLLTWADNNTGRCYPNFTQIQERIKMSKNTISKSVKILQSTGLIEVQKGRKKGNLKPNNIYIVETEITPKTPIAKNGIEGSKPIAKNGIEPIANFDIPLSQNLGHNYTHLTKLNKELEEGEKAPLTPQITQSELVLNEPKITKLDMLKSELSDLEDYPKQDRLDFYAYWTEVDSFAKKKVMRFEKAKPFNVKRRLATWMSKKADWQSPQQTKEVKDEFRKKATMNMRFDERIKWEYENGYLTDEDVKGWL